MSPLQPTPRQWAAVKQLFLECLPLPPAERQALLSEADRRDPSVACHARELLRADGDSPAFLDHSLHSLASPSPARHVPAPAIGAQIGGCTILSLLGEGAFGLVYRARQSRPSRDVAIKILRPGTASPSALRRLEREAEIMARLRHPGIAQVLASGIDDATGLPYFVMEYVEGVPLTEHARRHALSIRDRLLLFLRVCDAVQHAHGSGVIHRDLKPANIIVTDVGEPKILDFGVARVDAPDTPVGTITPFCQLVGTLAYMSPEQAAGNHVELDTRTDVYSLGAILYELLAGKPPLHTAGMPLPEAVQFIRTASPAPLGASARALRGDLETIVGKALEKSPERRYASASELAGDIRRHLGRMPIHARPPSALYELCRFAQRRRPLIARFGIALAALVGVLAWTLVARDRAREDSIIARTIAGSLLADSMQALSTTPGTYPVRRTMIDLIRGPVERFARHHPSDLHAQANLAALWFAWAELESESANDSAALQLYSDAFRVLTSIAGSDGVSIDWQLQRSHAAVRIGDIYYEAKESDSGAGWYLAALALDYAAVRRNPDDYTAQDQLVWSYGRIANRALDDGNLGDGRRYAELMDAAARSIVARWPDSPKAVWCRIGAHSTMAHLYKSTGDPRRADAECLQAIELGRSLVQLDPNRGYAIAQIGALCARANALSASEDFDAARSLLDEAHPLMLGLLSLDRHDFTAHETALSFYQTLYSLHVATGNAAAVQDDSAAMARQARAMARLNPRSIRAAVNAVDYEIQELESRGRFAPLADAADVVCALRDELLGVAARFPGRAEPYSLLVRLAQAPPLSAPPDAALAQVAADRAATLADPPNPAPLIELADLLEQDADPAGAAAVLRRAASLIGKLADDCRPSLESRIAALEDAARARR